MDLNPLVGVVTSDRIAGLRTPQRPAADSDPLVTSDPFHWPLLALAPHLRQRFRDRVANRMQLLGSSPVLGLDVGSVGPSAILTFPRLANVLLRLVDASPDFFNSTIFDKSPKSGFGGWGSPADDYQITTGAFADEFVPVYPVPHKVRRNYTARSLGGDIFGDGTPAAPNPFWTYFTPASVKALVRGHIGDFRGFQAEFESTTVSWKSLNDSDRCAGG